ncbi:hypothetical protein LIER_25745 [Lithospermum erythrorhizon]|uniref:Uncharacterized protein n=1 Tax=Lithospermum erythrorhizon TaxID=34254 RepID=A0AAV3R7Z1_LITER
MDLILGFGLDLRSISDLMDLLQASAMWDLDLVLLEGLHLLQWDLRDMIQADRSNLVDDTDQSDRDLSSVFPAWNPAIGTERSVYSYI